MSTAKLVLILPSNVRPAVCQSTDSLFSTIHHQTLAFLHVLEPLTATLATTTVTLATPPAPPVADLLELNALLALQVVSVR